jgi:hypothetical protein
MLPASTASSTRTIFSQDTYISSLSAQKQTAYTFIDAYNAWDAEAILSYRTPNCQHRILPLSMGRPAKSNDEYGEYLKKIMPLFSNFTVPMPLHKIALQNN